MLIFHILNSSSKSVTYTNVLLCCWDSFLTDASYLGALSAEDIYICMCVCVCVCAWRDFPSPWLHPLLRDFHVIFHAILMFNTNEDVPKNIWMRKYGKLSVKRLCWSLFQLSCKLKGNAQFIQKVTFNLWWVSNKTIMEVGNITKAATFKSFLHLSYKNTQLLFFVTVLFNIFMRQTLTDNFWGLHKNMNCAFPLKCTDCN